MSSRVVKTNAAVSATGVPAGLTNTFAASECYVMFALAYTVVSGSVASVSMQPEVTLDGTNWFPVGTPITALTGGLTVTSNLDFPFVGVRANVTVLTGTSPILNVTLGAGRYFQG
jgi:hypothetical protein